MRHSWALVFLAAGSALLTASCGPIQRTAEVESKPASEPLRVVAVLPFENSPEGVDLAQIVASEIPKMGSYRAVRPSEPARTAPEAVRAAGQARADVVVAATVTGYDPYDPPRISLSVQFLRVASRPLSGAELDRLVRSPSWRRGPLELTSDAAGNVISVFEAVYDVHDPPTRRDLAAYAAETGQDEREIALIQPRFLKFVAHRLAKRLLGAPDVP